MFYFVSFFFFQFFFFFSLQFFFFWVDLNYFLWSRFFWFQDYWRCFTEIWQWSWLWLTLKCSLFYPQNFLFPWRWTLFYFGFNLLFMNYYDRFRMFDNIWLYFLDLLSSLSFLFFCVVMFFWFFFITFYKFFFIFWWFIWNTTWFTLRRWWPKVKLFFWRNNRLLFCFY